MSDYQRLKRLAAVTLSAFTLSFGSMVLAEETGQPAPPAEQPKSAEVTTQPESVYVSEAAEPARPAQQAGELTFLDSQQAWTDSEVSGYHAWMKDNPRYSHPMFRSEYDAQRGVSLADDTPDPNYRPWRPVYNGYNRGAVSGVRGRTLWVNPRYVTGRYYTNNNRTSDGAANNQQPLAEPSTPGQSK